jgi:hypothetical protein
VIAPETELSSLRSSGRDDRWVPMSATEEEGESNDSGGERNGPWAGVVPGPKLCLGPFTN